MGFEPTKHCCLHAFQACAFNHSATAPARTNTATRLNGPNYSHLHILRKSIEPLSQIFLMLAYKTLKFVEIC